MNDQDIIEAQSLLTQALYRQVASLKHLVETMDGMTCQSVGFERYCGELWCEITGFELETKIRQEELDKVKGHANG